jgi:hypothetical protein
LSNKEVQNDAFHEVWAGPIHTRKACHEPHIRKIKNQLKKEIKLKIFVSWKKM